MTYTADYLIQKRREKWEELHSIDYDKKFRIGVANELVSNGDLREEIVKSPEKLIELLFIVVDKDKHTMPFFLNEVQIDFLNILNKANMCLNGDTYFKVLRENHNLDRCRTQFKLVSDMEAKESELRAIINSITD